MLILINLTVKFLLLSQPQPFDDMNLLLQSVKVNKHYSCDMCVTKKIR